MKRLRLKPRAVATRLGTITRAETGRTLLNIPIWAACLYEPDKASQRMAFNGYCLVLVQSNKQAGEIRLKVQSETLKGDEVIVKVQ